MIAHTMQNALLRFVLIAVLVLPGCSKSNRGPVAEPYTGPPLTLAVVAGESGDPFWGAVQSGANQAARELGNVEIQWLPPTVQNDVDSQIETLNSAVDRKVDGVVLSPLPSDELATVIRNSVNDGLPVIAINRGLDGAKMAATVSTDHFKTGKIAAVALAESIDEQGDVIVLRYQVGNDNMEERARGVLAGLAEYKKIHVVSSDQRGGGDAASAEIKVDELLLIFGEHTDGIVAVEQSNAVGALHALREVELAGKVKLVAFGPDPELIEALADETCSAIALQDPFRMGYLSVLTLVDTISGKKVDPFIPSGSHLMTSENQGSLFKTMPEYVGK